MSVWRNLWTAARTVLPEARHVTGEGIRDVADPTLERAAARAQEVVDRAAQHGHELLEDGEVRARRVVEEVDQRLAAQREQLLNRTESVCDRISRKVIWRAVLAGMCLLGAAGMAALLVYWAARNM
ncbi:MAG: hypothetical protein KIS92_03205 [Planctomycetota bacterium]|nr:hypothetical protein [Planctomycetota bacterium]